jgi:hypothetical protein
MAVRASVSVASWNILAHVYTGHNAGAHGGAANVLETPAQMAVRHGRINAALARVSADIVLLQEVDRYDGMSRCVVCVCFVVCVVNAGWKGPWEHAFAFKINNINMNALLSYFMPAPSRSSGKALPSGTNVLPR